MVLVLFVIYVIIESSDDKTAFSTESQLKTDSSLDLGFSQDCKTYDNVSFSAIYVKTSSLFEMKIGIARDNCLFYTIKAPKS